MSHTPYLNEGERSLTRCDAPLLLCSFRLLITINSIIRHILLSYKICLLHWKGASKEIRRYVDIEEKIAYFYQKSILFRERK